MRRAAFVLVVSLCLPVFLEARINLFDPWSPGQDTRAAELYAYQPAAAFSAGEGFQSLSGEFSYASDDRLELGGRWGVISAGGEFGIGDLLLGLKYLMLEESPGLPAVIGEAAVSLPTGDHTRGLGTGAAGLLLQWAVEKNIAGSVSGYFGLGARVNAANSDGVRQGDEFSYRLGAGCPWQGGWRFFGEFKGLNRGAFKVDGTAVGTMTQELYLAPGAEYRYTDRMTFSGALLIGLTSPASDLGLVLRASF